MTRTIWHELSLKKNHSPFPLSVLFSLTYKLFKSSFRKFILYNSFVNAFERYYSNIWTFHYTEKLRNYLLIICFRKTLLTKNTNNVDEKRLCFLRSKHGIKYSDGVVNKNIGHQKSVSWRFTEDMCMLMENSVRN